MTWKCKHPQTPENSYHRENGKTRCKKCHIATVAAYKRRNPEKEAEWRARSKEPSGLPLDSPLNLSAGNLLIGRAEKAIFNGTFSSRIDTTDGQAIKSAETD